MEILELFINFLDKILNFEILGFSLYIYLITITTVVIAIEIIKNMTLARGGKEWCFY